MTITAQTSKTGPYSGNGTTTVFSYTFRVQDEAHLVVTVLGTDGSTESIKVLNTDYTVTGVGDANGGTVVMVVAPTIGEKLTITRSVSIDQEIDLQNRGAVNPETLEQGLDKLTQIAQDQQEQLGRSLKVDLFEQADLDQLTLNVNTVAGIASDVSTVAGINAAVTAVAADATDIGTVSASIADVNTVAGISADVSTVAGVSANVTTVAGIDADVTTVAAGATDIGTVSASIADVNTVAGISADVTTVAADGLDIGVVSTNIADVNTVAGIAADVTTVAGVAADVTTVATNISDVTNFADVYVGGAASDPATRADGSALQAGDLYFNTGSDELFVYTGSAWTQASFTAAGFATLTGTETLTNKTLTAPTISAPVINGPVTGDVIIPEADWEAGTSTTEAIVSPAKVKAAIEVNAPKQLKAWGNFNGSAVTTRAAENLTIARTATGSFTCTMPNPMIDANYSAVQSSNTSGGTLACSVSITDASSFTLVYRRSDTNAAANPTQIFLQVVR